MTHCRIMYKGYTGIRTRTGRWCLLDRYKDNVTSFGTLYSLLFWVNNFGKAHDMFKEDRWIRG